VHIGKLRWQFQLIGDFSSAVKDFEWSDVPWCQLTLYLETMKPSHRPNLQVHKITDLDCEISSSIVSIVFLPWLCNLEPASPHFSAHLARTLGSHRSHSRTVVSYMVCHKKFKRRHLQTSLITVVVWEFCVQKAMIPALPYFKVPALSMSSKNWFTRSVYPSVCGW
jgi:hypothetical protein